MTWSRVDGERHNGLVEVDAETQIDSLHVKVSNDVSREPEMTSSSSAGASVSTVQGISSVERLLTSIHDLLLRRLHIEARLRRQMDIDQQMTSEWMIAAAVIDRICFIVLAVSFISGTAVFLFILFVHL